MEDKLVKRNKIDWMNLIHSFNYEKKFKSWCKGKKIRSQQRLAYMYIKHIKGRNFVSCLRRIMKHQCSMEELSRIAHTNWIGE